MSTVQVAGTNDLPSKMGLGLVIGVDVVDVVVLLLLQLNFSAGMYGPVWSAAECGAIGTTLPSCEEGGDGGDCGGEGDCGSNAAAAPFGPRLRAAKGRLRRSFRRYSLVGQGGLWS